MDNETPLPIWLVSREGAQLLQLAGVINIMSADVLLAAARAAAAAGGPVVAECARVESFDMSALQILVALKRELGRQGRRLRLVEVSPQVGEDITLAGMKGEFEITLRDGSADPTESAAA